MTEPFASPTEGKSALAKDHDDAHQARTVFLHGCELPEKWASQQQWRVLETGFGAGLRFLATWKAWRDDPARPQLLHFISVGSQPVSASNLDLLRAAPKEWEDLAQLLSAQLWGLLPGVHRLAFDEGRVLLTLCIGDTQAMVRQQHPQADSIYLAATSRADIHLLKAIARCCRRGTRLVTEASAREVRDDLLQCGFQVTEVPATSVGQGHALGVFDPQWEPRAVREVLPDVSVSAPGHCVIIGAGLAGSACAASLARRGWQVTVLDAQGPAAGASGLLAGVFSPHVSPDDSVLSRLSRAGVRTTLQTLSTMPRGEAWDETGVLEHRVDHSPGIPDDWAEPGHAGADWSRRATEEQCARNAVPPDAVACWHVRAGWVRPPDIVNHQLTHERIRVMGNTRVDRLVRNTPSSPWQALDQDGKLLAEGDMVIITAGFDSAALLERRWPLQALRGQISWGMHADAPVNAPWPQVPVNGHGNLVPRVPLKAGMGWVLGSTFERDVTDMPPSPADVAAAHAANLEKFSELTPPLADAMAQPFEQAQSTPTHDGAVRNWAAVRCASHDRLPIVGPVDQVGLPGLWVSTAMGSRGLTLSVLCAELLAARLHHEPLPMEARLAQLLSSERMAQR